MFWSIFLVSAFVKNKGNILLFIFILFLLYFFGKFLKVVLDAREISNYGGKNPCFQMSRRIFFGRAKTVKKLPIFPSVALVASYS